ncbi:MAG: endonuclease III [Lachnospirales bacterium]
MNKRDKVKIIIARLDERYPQEDKCYLNYTHDYELLIATILSAQCTDDRVNLVTEKLFKKYKSLDDFANSDLYELMEDVKSTGFYKNKAKNIKSACYTLIEKYNYILPYDINDLTTLAGVGRKTANVVRGHIFALPSIVVDTHVKRISNRLGLTKNEDPVKIEFDLMKILPKKSWIKYNQQVIAFGREICKARGPKCSNCFMSDICIYSK